MRWLIHTSALAHLGNSPLATEWLVRIERAEVRVCTTTLLQVGELARGNGQLRALLSRPPLSVLPVQHLTPQAERRAVQVQALLAEHAAATFPTDPAESWGVQTLDLLAAASAEVSHLVLLHQDPALERVARVTGQPAEYLHTEPADPLPDRPGDPPGS